MPRDVGKGAPDTWDLWLDEAHTPADNMALDEALLLTSAARGRPVLRVYEWDRPAVTIGYVQTHDAAPDDGFAVIRRPTGGGVVFHDHDVTYSVVVPAGHWLAGTDRLESYGIVNRAVQNGLGRLTIAPSLAQKDIAKTVDRSRMVCFQTPTRYDVLASGRKVAGSAQRRMREGLLHQGSIHFGGPLPFPRDRIVDLMCEGFREELGVSLVPYTPSEDVLATGQQLVRERYATDAWNRRR
jgi:lipoate-protein ligase A